MNAVLQIEAGKVQSRDWPTVPLGEIVDVLDSKRKPITKRDRTAGPYPYYGATGVLDWVEGFLFDEPLVLVGEDGAKWAAGDKSAFPISGKTWVNNHAHALRPHRDKVIDDWLVYFLNATDLSDFISGMTVPKLNQGQLREIPIPIPPLDEQKRIVAVLDKAFAALDRARVYAEDNFQDSNLLFKEVLHRTIYGGFRRDQASFSKCSLADALDVIRNGVNCDQKAGGRCKISRIESIATGSFNLDRVGFAELTDSQKERARLLPGDILFSHINSVPHVGKTAVFDVDDDVYHGINLLLLRPSKGILSSYMSWFLKAVHATKYWEGVCKKSVNQASVNQKDIGKVPFFFPSTAKQSQVVQKLDAVSIQVANARQSYIEKLSELANLHQSLLQKAFSGGLT